MKAASDRSNLRKPGLLDRMRDPVTQLQALLAMAIFLGGGGVAYGFHNLAIQIAALAMLAANPGRVRQFLREAPRTLIVLVLLTLALPLLQLIPLPPAIWQSLPGRDLVISSFAVAGIPADSWFPVSVDRARTLVAFCGTLAPAAIIAIGTTLLPAEKRKLIWTLVILAMASFFVGVVQISSANNFGLLFPITAKPDVLYATFANRNSTGLLFVIAAIMVVSLPLLRGRAWLLSGAVIVALLILGTITTQSRSSMALLAVLIGFLCVRLFIHWRRRNRQPDANAGKARIAVTIFGLAFVAAVLASVAFGGRAADSFVRLTDTETDRPEVWEDGLYAAQHYWPAGSGMGTFDEVFQLDESLEYVSLKRAGRAHNDYIEVAMEAGFAGLLLIACWLVWCLIATLRNVGLPDRWIQLGAGCAIGCMALQSLLDYPLRNQALLCTAALLVVMLAQSRGGPIGRIESGTKENAA